MVFPHPARQRRDGGYDEERSAHGTVESIYLAFAKHFGVGLNGKLTAEERAATLKDWPVPYTKDSLKPKTAKKK